MLNKNSNLTENFMLGFEEGLNKSAEIICIFVFILSIPLLIIMALMCGIYNMVATLWQRNPK